MKSFFRVCAVGILLWLLFGAFDCYRRPLGQPGADVAEKLRAAADGAPLRVVLFGGSITQSSGDCIFDWLRQKFPKSAISIHNSGLAGTGSSLGVFRLERDVIAYDPQLVFIEFCVNDRERGDAEVIRDLESIVLRLKQLPRPPSIVMLLAAQDQGLNKSRHQRVADHYNLLTIDVDEALHRYILEQKLDWSDFMNDPVHPNERGHAFYGSVIAQRLEALGSPVPAKPPIRPLTEQALIIDGRMTPLRSAPGWSSDDVPAGREFRSFVGLIKADQPGTTLTLSFRGTAVGLMYPMKSDQGSFYVSIDDGPPELVLESLHNGYSVRILADNLASGEHVLTIVLPALEPTPAYRLNGPVRLGYLMTAGGSLPAEQSGTQNAGVYNASTLKALQFQRFPAASIAWIGPLAKEKEKTRRRANMDKVYPPETEALEGKFALSAWRALPGKSDEICDLQALSHSQDSGVFILANRVISPSGGPALLRIMITGLRKVWLNGEPLAIPERLAEFEWPFLIPVQLRGGPNDFVFKLGTIEKACSFSASLGGPGAEGATFSSPLLVKWSACYRSSTVADFICPVSARIPSKSPGPSARTPNPGSQLPRDNDTSRRRDKPAI